MAIIEGLNELKYAAMGVKTWQHSLDHEDESRMIITADGHHSIATKYGNIEMEDLRMNAIISDIREGLQSLGFRGHVELLRIGYNRLAVLVNGSNVGIWDVARKTFCD